MKKTIFFYLTFVIILIFYFDLNAQISICSQVGDGTIFCIDGPVIINDGSQGAGKVLTSDSIGQSGWVTLLPADPEPGEMLYHNGDEWTSVAPGTNGQTFTFCNGVPTWTTDGQCPLKIGQFHEGGVIFYLDSTGQSGLVCDISNIGLSGYGCIGTQLPGADGTALGTGAQNTTDILAACATPGIAADLCANSTVNGYSDWYLPSVTELNEIYKNKNEIDSAAIANGGTALENTGNNNKQYWSSSQYDNNLSWAQTFDSGVQNIFTKNTPCYVRAIRAFGNALEYDTSLKLGDIHEGGYIYYLEPNGVNGLVASPNDRSAGREWGCDSIDVAGADGTAIGTGAQNTADIVADSCHINDGYADAAQLCASFSGGGFTNWVLPSLQELNSMYNNLHTAGIGGFSNSNYWTSSEVSSTSVYYVDFNTGYAISTYGKTPSYAVRPSRDF